ncbi:hypothetical protein LTR56_026161 [Elasticomyces elasticus]|nr:hypothetical protein LTR56_026161 [Elasticomyces elasticus]KAK5744902.1 hypothetical protein LTS12_023299 [Elasticomyces elasticus]
MGFGPTSADVPAEQAHSHTKHGAMQSIWERANEHAEASERRKQDATQSGDTTETTPWIRRTGWDRYSSGCDRSNLLEAIAEPEEGDDQDCNNGRGADDEGGGQWVRKVDYVLWKTMEELAAINQATVG